MPSLSLYRTARLARKICGFRGKMPKNILVVDDSQTMRKLINFALTKADYAPTEAADGEEALFKLRNNRFDMMICDLNMPKMDGIELISKVRSMDEHKFMPIVVLTTELLEEKKQKARAAGATAWIVKPFKDETVLAVVKKVLG